MSERVSLFIGRFQPLHGGHKALIQTAIDEGKPVVAALMDTALDEDNPYTVAERREMFRLAFADRVQVIAIPPIAEVCWGRNVGYRLRHIKLPAEVEAITATALRESGQMPAIHVMYQAGGICADAWSDQWNKVARRQHQDMADKGWWPAGEDRNDGEMIALIHSELSEVLECLRAGDPPDKDLPQFSGAEVQMADVIGRIMDMSEGRGWRVAEAFLAKMAHNRTREHRHGKVF